MRPSNSLALAVCILLPCLLSCNASSPAGDSGTTGSATAGASSTTGTSGETGGTGATSGTGGSTTGGSSTGGAATPPGIGSFCPAGPFASPLPASPTVTVLAGPTYDHFDGPVWLDASGTLLFSAWNNSPDAGNGPESAIVQLTPPTAFAVVSQPNQIGSNGLVVDGNGAVVACAHDRRQVDRFPAAHLDNADRQVIASMFNGQPFNSPNDAAIRADGTVYFTDPNYQADSRTGQAATNVFRISPTGDVSVVDGSRDQPNGIALSLDQNWLYVGANDNLIQRYAIAADGSTGPAENFISAGTNVDGMTVDCAGNIYASLYSNNRVGIWTSAGTSLGSITLSENVTNVAFGGSDHKTLYITSVTHLNSIVLAVPGLPY